MRSLPVQKPQSLAHSLQPLQPSTIDIASDEHALDAPRNAGSQSTWLESMQESDNRSLAERLYESSEFFAFKCALIKHPHDAFILAIAAAVFAFTTVSPFISWVTVRPDNAPPFYSSALAIDVTLAILVNLLFLSLVGMFFALERISPDGPHQSIRSLALRFKNSQWFPICTGLLSVASTVRACLHMIWYAVLDTCTSTPALSAYITPCNPAGMSLRSDSVATVFVAPLLVLVFMPGMPFRVCVVSWLIGFVSMCVAYALKGMMVDSYNLLNLAAFLYTLYKVDALMWSAFVLHRVTLEHTEREMTAACHTRALELALVDAEKKAAERSAAEIRHA
jgi:hypothetical protein